MALANFSVLLFGSLLVAVPIVIHLIMRQQPKHVIFPALHFLRRRRESTRRRLRVRHWLLLFLRCAAICLLAAALARPSVAAAAIGTWLMMAGVAGVGLVAGVLTVGAAQRRKNRLLVGGLGVTTLASIIVLGLLLPRAFRSPSTGVLGNERAPVAAVLVFDTSPRMGYVHQNQTRLEQAREGGRWLLGQLPEDSEVGVLDSRLGPATFAMDRGAAARAIDALRVTNVPVPLVRVLENSVRLASQSDKGRREIYVFTDLTEAAWTASAADRLREEMGKVPDAVIYLWDVGVTMPRNSRLGQLRISSESPVRNSIVRVRVELMTTGGGGRRVVELYLEEPNEELPIVLDGAPVLPEARLRSREVVEVDENGSQWVSFSVRGLDVGTHHGYVKISGQDGLSCDDVRYFTIAVAPPWPVLLVKGRGAESAIVSDALAPREFRDTGRARFEPTTVLPDRVENVNLSDYAAVCLLDPGPQPQWFWNALCAYVRQGGGLAILLGRNAEVEPFQALVDAQLLPGPLARTWRIPEGKRFLAPRSFEHPILAPFRQDPASVPWDRAPVYWHWGFRRLDSQSTVLVRYGNDQPALIEHTMGDGRILTMTTPLSDPLHVSRRPAWNELLTSLESWPSLVLCNEMLTYLVGSGDRKLNYLAGQTAFLPAPQRDETARLQLFTPDGDWRDLPMGDGGVSYPFTERLGTYRVKGQGRPLAARGFSVNLPAEASVLDRIDKTKLDQIMGPDRYRLARSRAEIDRGVGEARVGREFYPYLMILLVMALGAECLLANRFYRDDSSQEAVAPDAVTPVRVEPSRAKSA